MKNIRDLKIHNKGKSGKLKASFEKVSNKATRATGSPIAFISALLIVIIWAVTGPIFNYSDTWQLVINTGTTIITFLMVFIIQQSQNKDTVAMQIKLNELIACHEKASNRLIDVEDLTDDELQVIRKFYEKLADLAEEENGVNTTHSLDEAENLHRLKRKIRTGG
jgi:Predicted small integral membrane protein